ncbi:MAG: hypothetical protein ACKN9U_10400, partial [Pirellulaceae bacterium]
MSSKLVPPPRLLVSGLHCLARGMKGRGSRGVRLAIEFLSDLADARLEPYRHLRTRNLTRFSGRFIAESRPLVERLLASSYEIESIVV